MRFVDPRRLLPALAAVALLLPATGRAASPAAFPHRSAPFPRAFDDGAGPGRHGTPALRQALTALGLVGASFALDKPSLNLGRREDRWPDRAVEEPGDLFGSPFVLGGGTGALLAAGVIFHKPEFVRTSKELTLSVAAATVAATAIKVVSDRTRPNGKNDYSFPSGHATGAFAMATVLDREFGGWVGPVAYSAAGAVGFSRMADRYHYFSDVMAGAVLGHFIGKWVTHRSPETEH